MFCNICGNNKAKFLYTHFGTDKKRYNLYKCNNCGVVFVWPLPEENFLANFYSTKYSAKFKQGIIKLGKPKEINLQIIEDCYTKIKAVEHYANIKKRGKLLDVGCGHGFFVFAANNLGYKAKGVDIDKEAINYGREQLGIDVMENSLYSIKNISLNSIDVVTMWTVLEHLRFPKECCTQIYKLLKIGGVFCGAVPNIGGLVAKIQGERWHLIIPPEHLYYFNKSSINKLLIEAGFEPLFIGTIPLYAAPYFSFGIRRKIMDFSNKINLKAAKIVAKFLHRTLTLIKRYFIYYLINMFIVKLNLGGDNILFVACKRRE